VACRLLVGVGDPYHLGLGEGSPYYLEPGGEATVGGPHWDAHPREPRVGRYLLAVVTVGALEVANFPRRVAPGWIDEHVHALSLHGAEDSLPQGNVSRLHIDIPDRR